MSRLVSRAAYCPGTMAARTPKQSALSSCLYTYRAEPVRVVDGDTVELVVDLGFRIGHRMTIRLTGIDAKELSQPKGYAARAYLELLLGGPGELYLKSQKDKPDKYGGRYLGNLIKGDTDINHAMLDAGHATPYTGRGPK